VQTGLDQFEQSVIRPVQIFDQDDGGLLGHELFEERNPGLAQTVACSKWVKVCRRLEAERQAENLALAESTTDGLRRVTFEQSEMLANDFAER